MATYTGTNGDDYLVGGNPAGDTFNPLLGMDQVVGGVGRDRLNVAYAPVTAPQQLGRVSIIDSVDGSFAGTVRTPDGANSVAFSSIERLYATFSGGDDTVYLDAAAITGGNILSFDGGAGSDRLVADFSSFAGTSFKVAQTGVVTANHGGYANFETFDLTLGGGTNAVTLQGGNDRIVGGSGNDTLDGGAGIDTIDYSAAAAGVSVSLATNKAQATLGAGTDLLKNFENLVGSGFGDTLTGGTGDNLLTGGAGNDRVDGGLGVDTASYSGNSTDYTVSSANGVATIADHRGTDGIDSVTNVERFAFANGTFTLAELLSGAPVAVDDKAGGVVEAGTNTAGQSAASGNALTNDGDADPASLHLTGIAAGSAAFTNVNGTTTVNGTYGTLQVHPDGSYAYMLDDSRSATDALAEGQHASDLFTYRISDAQGLTASASIAIDITGSDDTVATPPTPPTVHDDVLAVTRGIASSLDAAVLLANDSGPAGDMLSVTGVDNATGGTVALSDGKLVVTAAGATGGFDYTVTGSDGASSTGHASFASLVSGNGSDTLTAPSGVAGADLQGQGATDMLTGSAGADHIVGGPGDDTIAAGAGDDVIAVSGANQGYDSIDGGAGYDTILALADKTVIGLRSVAGIEAILSNGHGDVEVDGTVGNDHLDFINTVLIGITKIDGGIGDDYVGGSNYRDLLLGGPGNDILDAHDGPDHLSGGGGDDTLLGGAGDDILHGNEGNDAVDGGDGNDIARFRGNHADYTITQDSMGRYVVTDHVDGRDGIDTVANCEQFQFADGYFKI